MTGVSEWYKIKGSGNDVSVRIFPYILWATINCSFGFMKNGFDVI
jgi:hypothetical protein